MGLAAMIMLYAGLRNGEVLALEWTDIDFSERTITVSKSRTVLQFAWKNNNYRAYKQIRQ